MGEMIDCVKLGTQAEGLDRQPYPGDLGKRILSSISKQAWQEWMGQQTILINENRLNLMDPKGRAYLEEQMVNFLFGDGADMPEEFTPPKS